MCVSRPVWQVARGIRHAAPIASVLPLAILIALGGPASALAEENSDNSDTSLFSSTTEESQRGEKARKRTRQQIRKRARAQDPIPLLTEESAVYADDITALMEPRGGEANLEPLQLEPLDLENRFERRRQALKAGRDLINQQQREPEDEAGTAINEDDIAELEGRDNGDASRKSFEDEFIAAERALEEQQTTTRRQQQRGRQLDIAQNLRGTLTAEDLSQEAQSRANRQYREPDINDITGSIQPTSPENIYAADGKRLGTFLLYPEFSILGQYSDNPAASTNNGPGDIALIVSPRFLLRSNWSRHQLEITGALTKGYYEELKAENIDTWNIGATGRLDIERNHYIELEGRLEQAQDDRGDIDSLNNDADLAAFQVYTIAALYHKEWNRTTLRLSGRLSDYDYDDATDSLGNTINNDDEDYLETAATARLSYTFHPGFMLYTEGRFEREDYRVRIDDEGFERSNKGGALLFGGIYDLSSHLRLSAALGVERIDADEPSFDDLEELVYSASLIYRYNEHTTLTISASRELETTDINGAIGYIENSYEIDLVHYFRPHVRLGASFLYEREDYKELGLDEETLSAELSLQYIFNKRMRLLASYEFADTSFNGTDYQENILRLGLTFTP